jgi:hypothetical protein
MYPFCKFSSRNLSSFICSAGVRGYTLQSFRIKSDFRSIVWSQGLDSGKHSDASFSKLICTCDKLLGGDHPETSSFPDWNQLYHKQVVEKWMF